MKKLTIIFVTSYLCLKYNPISSTEYPIIGLLAQEYDVQAQFPYIFGNSYIAASYVKAIEASGARVVPIHIGKSESYYRTTLYSINGVVIPGGAAPLSPGNGYYDAATFIYKIALELNSKGVYFPILAICLGFEALLVIANNHKNPQIKCNINHENYPLIFQPAAKKSLLYSNLDEKIFISLKYLDVTVNNHIWCTTPENFNKSALSKEWRITTTNVNSYGLKFISSVELDKYPILAIQFHPEKVMFEWKEGFNFPHSNKAIEANRYFYDMLVKLAKCNDNHFPSKKIERSQLIYNHQPIYAEDEMGLEQIYYF